MAGPLLYCVRPVPFSEFEFSEVLELDLSWIYDLLISCTQIVRFNIQESQEIGSYRVGAFLYRPIDADIAVS